MDCAIFLCEEIVIEILSRLPTKSLVRFMAVCRLWKSIITSPQFQLSKRPTKLLVHTPRGCYTLLEDHHKENRRLMFETDSPKKHYSYDHSASVIGIDSPYSYSYEHCASVIGSDNGLICIRITSPPPTGETLYYNNDRVIIWNPCIRKHVVIPDDPFVGEYKYVKVKLSGFGDYKYIRVVRLFCRGGYERVAKFAVDIYSLKAGTWRRKYLDGDITQGMQEFYRSCALLRGRLHWICGEDKEIFSFELEDEVFDNHFMVPESVRSSYTQTVDVRSYTQTVDVTVIRESQLGVITNGVQLDVIVIGLPCCVWVMERYGDVSSWIKLWNIDLFNAFPFWVERNMVHLLKDGELLLGLRAMSEKSINPKLVTYDQETRKKSNFDVSASSSSQEYDFTSYYKESLVLLGDLRAVADHLV